MDFLKKKTLKKMEFPDLTCPLKTWLSGKDVLNTIKLFFGIYKKLHFF